VDLACSHSVPLFVHTRSAFQDTLRVLLAAEELHGSLPPTIVHCFTGGRDELVRYVQMGFYVGVTGFVNKPAGAAVREMLADGLVPLDRLCIETDAPYMGFPGCKDAFAAASGLASKERKKLKNQQFPNTPCSLPLVLGGVTAALNAKGRDWGGGELTEARVAELTTENANRLFKFS
ncbi:hypothetical protein TeGR_g3122, partial [Tetraparma gracilis]